MKTKYDRARVMLDAKRLTFVGVPYSVALKESWRAEKLRVLKQKLATGIVEFTFKEAGCQVQSVTGTLAPHLIPSAKKVIRPVNKNKNSPFVSVYDTKEDKWKLLNNSTVQIEFVNSIQT